MPDYDIKLHEKLIEIGSKLETKQTHELDQHFTDEIMDTLERFGASIEQMALARFDLRVAKYKIYDWLGMAYTGRYLLVQDPPTSQTFFETIEKLVKLYILKANVEEFNQFLFDYNEIWKLVDKKHMKVTN